MKKFIVILALLPSVVLASVPDLVGYGARATAMVGGVGASARGADAVYYNPAALSLGNKSTVSIGFSHSDFRLTIDGVPRSAPSADAAYFGFALPLPFGGLLKKRVAIGASFVVPRKSIFMARVPAPGVAHFPIIETRAQTVSLMAAMGIKLHEKLSIGAGIMALSALDGTIIVTPDASGRIGSEANDELVVTFSPILSVHARLPRDGNLLIAWRAASSAQFDLPIDADLGERFPIAIPRLHVLGTAQYDPAQWTAELAVPVTSWLLLSVGTNFRFWSDYPVPLQYAAKPEAHPPLPSPSFQDTADVYGAWETSQMVGHWKLLTRAGYRYVPSPVPAQSGLYNHLDSDRHVIGLGLGLARGRVEANLGLQWFTMERRSHTKDDEQLMREGWIGGENPGAPCIEHQGDGLSVSFDLRLAL